jgi:hypothetical protein
MFLTVAGSDERLISRATAFLALKVSPSLMMYVRGVYRAKLSEDTNARLSLVCPPERCVVNDDTSIIV